MDNISINLWSFFEWLLKTTIQGSILICLILLVKAVLRDKLPIRWHYYLWLLLLVRILLPWAPPSRLSIFNLIPSILQAETIVPFAKRAAFFGFASFLPYVWLVGALILGGFILLQSFILWRVVKRERPVTKQKILDLLEDCKMEMGIQTILGVVESDRIKSSALFGFIRPRLLLPKGMIETHKLEELRYIFIHELAHLKQRDIYLSWLMTLLQVVYWFNPLMWFALRRIRLEREFACDGLALSMLSTDEPPRYGHTIVNLLERFSHVNYVPSIAGIIEDTSQIERRIKTIAGFKETSRAGLAIAVLVFALLASVALTDPYTPGPPYKFGILTNLGPTVNSSAGDYGPEISADGLKLFFHSPRLGGFGNSDIWVTTRATTDDPWGPPVNLGPTVNSSYLDASPDISADGLKLFFSSDRPGGYGNDIWVTSRATTNDPWSEPVNLGPNVNSSHYEGGPSISADGLTLYFNSNRPGGSGEWDLWVTRRPTKDSAWSTPVNLGPIVNSSVTDLVPDISADGLKLFFFSDRPGGFGQGDIWVTSRATTNDPWSEPVNLGPNVNSSHEDVDMSISADGLTLYFNSNRPGGSGQRDLWQVSIFQKD